MLFDQDPGRQSLSVVFRQHRNPRLGDNRAGIELGLDEMNGAAVLLQAGGERARVSVQATQIRQQRRVDVQHPPTPTFDELRPKDAHETGETNKIDRVGFERRLQRRLERFAVSIALRLDGLGGNPRLAGEIEAGRVKLVGED